MVISTKKRIKVVPMAVNCLCHCQPNCSISSLINILDFKNSSIRPVKNWKNVTYISIDMTLYTVVQLDTSLQSLTTLIWFNMAWTNEFINWDPSTQCSIKQVLMTGDNFWKPDLYVYEMTENSDKSPVTPYYTVEYTGKITNAKPMRIVSSCHLDILKFPFDTQKCNLTFGPYIHPVEDIIMYPKSNAPDVLKNSQKVFLSKGDWNLVNINVNDKTILSEGVTYSTVYYEITLKRVPIVYILTLIIPACLMVLLDIGSMFIQMESGERLGFKITIVLGFSVLLLILNNLLPTSKTAPVLGIFCCICMAVMVSSIFGCIVVSYMLMMSESQPNVPPWIRIWILKYLARVLCFKEKSFKKYGVDIPEMETYDNRSIEANLKSKKKTPKDNEDSLDVKLLKRLLMEILRIHEELVNSRNKEDVKTEWYAAALVVDRLVILVYLIIVIILFTVVVIIWMT
ncbi:5-hydroxytryptamine receptor 3A-like [Mixophyes fleayi]|uniref:5-hydroxytryptamine receptor 3A-like n=1 Tax=Mixophyes fleayi TaxID=3061075 RepID=UPI003F4E2133